MTFFPAMAVFVVLFLVLSSPLLVIDLSDLMQVCSDAAIRSSLVRTVWTSLVSTCIAIALAVPAAYSMTFSPRMRRIGDLFVDTTLAMPPLVIGLCLVLLFRKGLLRPVDDVFGISFQSPAIVLAQTVVATSLAIRLLRSAFDRLSSESIEVARVLGGSPDYVFRHVALVAARRDIIAASLLAWSRAFGEFGPVLMFAGVTRFQTQVLSTSIHLEMSAGNVGAAATIAVGMIVVAAIVTLATHACIRPITVRVFGRNSETQRS